MDNINAQYDHNQLRNMTIKQLASFSLLSEESKNLVKQLGYTAPKFRVDISNHVTFASQIFTVMMRFSENINEEWQNEGPIQLPIPICVTETFFVVGGPYYEHAIWVKEGFTVRDWLKHFMDIFNCSEVHIRLLNNCDRYDIESIRQTFHGLNIIGIGCLDRCPNGYTRSVLETFMPVRQLSLERNPFQDANSLNQLLIQNFDFLNFKKNFSITMDQVSLMNSSIIEVEASGLSEKDLNCFIKLWIAGSHPRLKCIFLKTQPINYTRNFIPNVLKGVEYQIAPENQRRTFKKLKKDFDVKDVKFKGGYDIQRNDGTEATILFDKYRRDIVFKMMIWP